MKIRHPWLTKLAAGAAVALLRLLFRTLRIKIDDRSLWLSGYLDTGPERYLYCIWHDSMLIPIFARRPRNMAALVSQHQDGSYLTEAMKLVGMSTVRGSTKRGGARAIRQLMETAKHEHISITPDGPRGPRRRVKSGIVFLASCTGRAVIPVASACGRAWRIQGSWTDMMIPKPFTTVHGLAGEPIRVPPNLSREELDRHTFILQEAMDRLDAEAQRLAHGTEQTEQEKRAAA